MTANSHSTSFVDARQGQSVINYNLLSCKYISFYGPLRVVSCESRMEWSSINQTTEKQGKIEMTLNRYDNDGDLWYRFEFYRKFEAGKWPNELQAKIRGEGYPHT